RRRDAWRIRPPSGGRLEQYVEVEPACRGPHPLDRRHARATTACRRSGPPSRPDAIRCSAKDDADVTVVGFVRLTRGEQKKSEPGCVMSGLKLLVELFSLRMGLSDGREHRSRIGRLSHRLGFGIMAIVH